MKFPVFSPFVCLGLLCENCNCHWSFLLSANGFLILQGCSSYSSILILNPRTVWIFLQFHQWAVSGEYNMPKNLIWLFLDFSLEILPGWIWLAHKLASTSSMGIFCEIPYFSLVSWAPSPHVRVISLFGDGGLFMWQQLFHVFLVIPVVNDWYWSKVWGYCEVSRHGPNLSFSKICLGAGFWSQKSGAELLELVMLVFLFLPWVQIWLTEVLELDWWVSKVGHK